MEGIRKKVNFGEELYGILERNDLLDDLSQKLLVERKIDFKRKQESDSTYWQDAALSNMEKVPVKSYSWTYDVNTKFYLDDIEFFSSTKEISGDSVDEKTVPIGVNGMFRQDYCKADGLEMMTYEKGATSQNDQAIYFGKRSTLSGNRVRGLKAMGIPNNLRTLLIEEEDFAFTICEYYKNVYDDLIRTYGLSEFQDSYESFEKLLAEKDKTLSKRS